MLHRYKKDNSKYKLNRMDNNDSVKSSNNYGVSNMHFQIVRQTIFGVKTSFPRRATSPRPSADALLRAAEISPSAKINCGTKITLTVRKRNMSSKVIH